MSEKSEPDHCPPGCDHVGFHYCGAAGTHCDIHCSCDCQLCIVDRTLVRAFSKLKQPTQERLLAMTGGVVRAGVAVFLFEDEQEEVKFGTIGRVELRQSEHFLVMQRRGSHGAGTWGLPGGHIDAGETAAQAAVRELKEELNVALPESALEEIGWSEAQFPEDGKYYITLLYRAMLPEGEAPELVERDKCVAMQWVARHPITGGGLPDPLFPPLDNYIYKYGVPTSPKGESLWRPVAHK